MTSSKHSFHSPLITVVLLYFLCLSSLPGQKVGPPPPPPPYRIVCSDMFRIVDEMPRFYQASCEACTDPIDRDACAKEALFSFIKANLRYPAEQCVAGTCVVTFVVEKDGSLTDIRLVRDIGAGCGKEAIRVVRNMSAPGSWVEGKHRGKAVRVKYNLPVRFSLE